MRQKIETDHLLLRKAKKDDLDSIWNNIWKQEEIACMMLWPVTATKEEAKERLQRTIEYQKKYDAFFVCLKETNEPIGFAGVRKLIKNDYEETGICIAKKHQGKGYAKEVVNALKKIVFEDLRGDRFIYGCFQENDRSRRVCLSLGFKFLYTQETVREWDQSKHKTDYYYFSKEMYKKENIL